MNKLIQLFHQHETLGGRSICVGTFAILETPCYPCTYYFGPANFVKGLGERTGEWYTGDNATSNFHRTLTEAHEAARKRLPEHFITVACGKTLQQCNVCPDGEDCE